MKSALALRKPAQALALLDTGSTSVTSSAYVTILAKASNLAACSAICVTNAGAQPLKIALGYAAAEVDTGIVIPPAAYAILLPIEIPKGVRLSLKSLGGTQSSGVVTISFFV